MKDNNKCPFCSSPIQENASFCLHCMHSLDSKTVINKKKSKKFLIIGATSALIILVLIALLLIFHTNADKKINQDQTSSQVVETKTPSTEIGTEDSSEIQNDTKKSFGSNIISKISDALSGSKESDESKADEKSNNSSKSDSVNSNSSKSNSQKSESLNSENSNSHSHEYTSKVVKSATCNNDGEMLYTCSCGETYTENIPATGKHNFVAVTKMVHHDEVGHYENVKIADSYTWYKCPQCGEIFNSLNSYYSHFDSVHIPADPLMKYIRDGYIHGTVPAEYEQKWIVDKEAYDEKITTGYKCSVCGKTK